MRSSGKSLLHEIATHSLCLKKKSDFILAFIDPLDSKE